MGNPVIDKFGNRIRLRACGLSLLRDGILLINHKGLYSHDFWAPPGGEVEFGELVEAALKREFKEECQSDIDVVGFRFACEFVRPPLHAIELFFEVVLLGEARLGHDPELKGRQIISDIKSLEETELQMLPAQELHGMFGKSRNPSTIMGLKGFFNFT